MASCSDLTKFSSLHPSRPLIKATPIPALSGKRFVEPFNRLKNRANLFRRRNYSSQLDISDPRSSLPADHFITSHRVTTPESNITKSNHLVLKRSNSMICPQQRLQSFLNSNNIRTSICVELADCPTDESSTDDFHFVKSSSNRYFGKATYTKMSNISEQEAFSSGESLHEPPIDGVSSLPNHNNNEQTSATLSSSRLTKNVIGDEQKQPLLPPLTSLPSTLTLHDHPEAPAAHHRPNSNLRSLSKRQSVDEPFYDCKQRPSPDMSLPKISTCTMTGKSLNNLDECSSTTSSEDKGVQTTSNDLIIAPQRAGSSTSLSSSSTSIQTDSLEHKPTISKHCVRQPAQPEAYHKRSNIHDRLLSEGTCIYWVNYLGSTAIKISSDNTPTMPAHAIGRLRQSTQYARMLPVIGLSISSRGVEFLKHTKDRVVICFHDIKSIHCACQDQDLRYFAYVTREQRLVNGMSNATGALDPKQLHHSPSLSARGDYHNYCHVFVVKNESMSTEILLTFGQAFDIAYQAHRRSNLKHRILEKPPSKIDVSRLPAKSEKALLLSTHSPAASSSSSSSSEERRVFI